MFGPKGSETVRRGRQRVSHAVSGLGAVVLVGILLGLMFVIGFALWSSGLAWIGAIAVAGVLGWVLWRILK